MCPSANVHAHMYKTGTRQTIQANLHHVTTAYVDVGKENAHVADVHLGVGNLAPLTLLVGRTEYAYPAIRDMETGSLQARNQLPQAHGAHLFLQSVCYAQLPRQFDDFVGVEVTRTHRRSQNLVDDASPLRIPTSA